MPSKNESLSLDVPAAKPAFSANHIPALDGVRAVAILAVEVFHFFQIRQPAPSLPGRAIVSLSHLGSAGVDLFFVLSGFLITGILIDAKGHRHALRNFYMRRVLRIFPLYYGFLIVTFVVLPLLHAAAPVPWRDQVWYWTYTSNMRDTFSHSFPNGPEHFWSLAIEEQFYLIWPFLALRYSLRGLIRICAGLIAGAIAARALVVAAGFNPFYFTLCRMDALASGALLASLIRLPGGAGFVRTWGRKTLLWTALVTAMAYFVLTGHANPFVQIVKYTLIAAFCTAVLSFALDARPGSPLFRVLTHPALRSIGTYSYGMYVIHMVIFVLVWRRTLTWPMAVCLPLEVGATYVAAWCIWHVWERPFLSLKKLFPSWEGAV